MICETLHGSGRSASLIVERYDRARSIIVMASSKGVAKAVCVKIDNSRFYQISRHVANRPSKFSLVVNKNIRTYDLISVSLDPVWEGYICEEAEILCKALIKRH